MRKNRTGAYLLVRRNARCYSSDTLDILCLFTYRCYVRIDLFSLIYALLFLMIPWAFIHSTIVRLRMFFILALIALITSIAFSFDYWWSAYFFSITNKGKDVFSIECTLNVRTLQHLGLVLWAHTTNRVLFIVDTDHARDYQL